MINFKSLSLFAAIASAAVVVQPAQSDDWPQWLGPQRDGVWRETGILEKFPKGGPTLRWKVKIGGGYSSPAIADGKVFVMDRVSNVKLNEGKRLGTKPRSGNFQRRLLPGKERLICLRESDGKQLWIKSYDCTYTQVARYAIGPRCIPTVDGDRVYTLGAEGHLYCRRVADGSVVWSRDFQKDYGAKVPIWGFAAHPLIDGDRLICVVGRRDAICMAFDKKTGREIWRSLRATAPGYCAPVIYKFGGMRQLIIWHSNSVNGLDPKTGKPYWSVPLRARNAMTIGVPLKAGNSLFVMSFLQLSALIRIAESGKSAKIVWKGNSRTGIGGVMNTAVLEDGYIYGCGHGGRYICARLDTGEWKWTTFNPTTGKRPASWATVFTIRHKDRFFLANDFGDLIIAKMTPAGYKEIDRARVIEPTHDIGGRTVVWSHPSFANRSVYLRNDREIRCFSLRQTK